MHRTLTRARALLLVALAALVVTALPACRARKATTAETAAAETPAATASTASAAKPTSPKAPGVVTPTRPAGEGSGFRAAPSASLTQTPALQQGSFQLKPATLHPARPQLQLRNSNLQLRPGAIQPIRPRVAGQQAPQVGAGGGSPPVRTGSAPLHNAPLRRVAPSAPH